MAGTWLRLNIGAGWARLETDTHEEGFRRFRPRGFRFHRLDAPKFGFEEFDELAVATAVKDLAYQGATRRQVGAREVEGELDELSHPRRVRGSDAGKIGGHVRQYNVNLPIADARFQRLQHFRFPQVAANEIDAIDRLELENVESDDRAVHRAGQASVGGCAAAELATHVLAPGARRRAEVDDKLAGAK